jgi:hypothetical protein
MVKMINFMLCVFYHNMKKTKAGMSYDLNMKK